MNVSDKHVSLEPGPSPTTAPVLPDTVGHGDASGADVVAFHRGGPASDVARKDAATRLLPAALLAAQQSGGGRGYPLYLPSGTQGTRVAPLSGLLAEALAATAAPAVARWGERFLDIASSLLDDKAGHADIGDIAPAAWDRFRHEFDASTDGAEDLEAQIRHVAARLPDAGWLVAADASTPIRLYFAALAAARSEALTTARAKARALAARAAELLTIDASHDPDNATPAAVSASLGAAASLFDPAALAGRVPSQRGSVRMEPARRARLAQARVTLLGFSDDDASDSPIVLTTGPLPWDALPEGAMVSTTAEAFAEAARAFDENASERAAVVAAMRVVELEAANAWDEELHAGPLATLSWEALPAEQLLLLRPVVVIHLATGDEGSRPDEVLTRFSRSIRTGRPIHVVIVDETSGLGSELSDGRLTGHHRGEALAAVTQRTAFVVQSTVAAPAHLAESLRRMAAAPRAGVAVIAAPVVDGGDASETVLAAMLEARGTPCFVYDPGSGDTWAERFELGGNPDVTSVWPRRSLAIEGSVGGEILDLEVTFADAAALVPTLRGHFHALAPGEWATDQVTLAEFLRAAPDTRRNLVPFIWAVDNRGFVARVVVSREIAVAAADRAHLWRFVQELGGVNNEHARRAAAEAAASARAEAESEIRAIEARHAAELEAVRQEAATVAIERLVAGLLDLHTSGALPAGVATVPAARPAAAPAAPAPAAEAAAPTTAATPAPAEDDDDAIGPAEAYIDSILCTTCNECTNLNALMFVYNSEKQATIADLAAGTFEQLVKAAEKCPARCIHPGAPRPGDATATPEMIARAAPFN